MPSDRTRSPGLVPQRCDVGGVPVAWGEAGAGPALLLIHGLSASSRWWDRNVPGLAERFHIYAIDLVGFGASRGRPRRPFMLAEAAELVAAWMAQVGLTRAEVVGHSMGGCVALDLAAAHPELVAHLVLVDAAILPPGTPLWRSAAGLVRYTPAMPLPFLPTLARDALRAGPLTILRASRQIHLADLRPRLSQVQAPTLVVWGERDTVVPPAVGKEIAAALPHAQLRTIPGAGHNAMWDKPDDFNALVTGFLIDPDHTPDSNATR
jgi:pimeloyl-ACP methyl ester carboxylesterase